MIERLKLSGVYAILNILNEKVYVGSAIHLYRRWRDHKSNLKINKSNCLLLQRAWNKYGEENFIFVVLELVEDQTKLVEIETSWIKRLDSSNVELGYNILPTGYSRLGLKASNETKFKMSLAAKRKPKSEEMKIKLSASKMGHSVSEETRIKIGLAGIGRITSEETKKKLSIAGKGRMHTIEARANMSNGAKDRKVSEEAKIKMSISRKGRKHSAETRFKMSEAQTKRHLKKLNEVWSSLWPQR